MTEEFLYHVWKFRLFNGALKTTEGTEVEILKPGLRNDDSGPDFFNSRIRIGDTTWAGNVEIDVKTSDWVAHGHDVNDAFSKIILHVVYSCDKNVPHKFPVVELKNFVDESLIEKYNSIITSPNNIPCAAQIADVDKLTLYNWIDRLLVERLAEKTEPIEQALAKNKFNWEETFYHHIARNFGFKINAQPFEMLAQRTPFSIIGKHKNNLLQIEALLFGQAGFLNDATGDEYYLLLKREYDFLKNKFSLSPMEKSLWKFGKLRPANFPTLRIAQFASLIHASVNLFSKITDCKNIKELKKLFAIEVSEYWKLHYLFGKKSKAVKHHFGQSSCESIIINTVVPFVFLYGKLKENELMMTKSLEWLETLKPENNKITRQWKACGMEVKHSNHSQGFIQLYNNYCTQKKCLQCNVGLKILNRF